MIMTVVPILDKVVYIIMMSPFYLAHVFLVTFWAIAQFLQRSSDATPTSPNG